MYTCRASAMAVSLQDAAIIVVVALAYGMLLAVSGIVLRWIVPPHRDRATLPTAPSKERVVLLAPDLRVASGQLLSVFSRSGCDSAYVREAVCLQPAARALQLRHHVRSATRLDTDGVQTCSFVAKESPCMHLATKSA